MSTETAAYWGVNSRFGFVANSDDGNEVGIDEKICVDYRGKIHSLLTAM